MLSRFQFSRSWPSGAAFPGSGIAIVFRRQMRCRQPLHDLARMGMLLLVHQSLAFWFLSMRMPLSEYSGDTARYLFRWLSMAAVSASLVYLPCAAFLGAMAVPPISRFEETQSMLLTRLAPYDVCAGRLFAWLWPVISALLASCALSLTVQVVRRPVMPDGAGGYAAIVIMHAALLTGACLIAAVGFLAATRRRPGRVWTRGALVATVTAVIAVFGLTLADSLLKRLEDPTGLIYALLLVNPAVAAATPLQVDTLRLQWVYERTTAHEYPFLYPPPLASCALFVGGTVGALALASVRLRRAYR